MNILCTYDDGAGTTFYLIYVIQSKYLFFAAIDLTFFAFCFSCLCVRICSTFYSDLLRFALMCHFRVFCVDNIYCLTDIFKAISSIFLQIHFN